MVHALEEIHRLLKPAGALIDIHPVSEPLTIEIHQTGRKDLVGNLSVRQWCVDFQKADEALTEVLRRGVFAVEHDGVFDSLTYYDSAEEMRAALRGSLKRFARDAQSIREAVPHVDEMVTRSENLMRATVGNAALIVRERTHIRRLAPA